MADPTADEVVGLKPALTGGVASMAFGATLPADAVTALTGATALGYLTDDGLQPTVDVSTDTKHAWGGDPIHSSQTDYSRTYVFTFAQALNVDVSKACFGDANVTETAATADHGKQLTILDKGATLPHRVYVFTGFDGIKTIRDVVEDGQIIKIEEGAWKDDELVTYKATVQTYRGSSTGAFVKRLTDDGVKDSGD